MKPRFFRLSAAAGPPLPRVVTVAFLVEHLYIIDDDSVEETQVDLSHAHFCSEFLGEGSGYGRAEEGLYWWQMQQYDEYHIKGEDSPDDTADDMFKSFQSLMNI